MRKMVDPKNVLVLGLGRSGVSAATLLAERGAIVTVVDRGDGSVPPEAVKSLNRSGVHILTNTGSLPPGEFDLSVVSPGVDCNSGWVEEARRRSASVISELELGFRYCRCPVIAVTGTNGKSTLTKLLYDMLRRAGFRCELGGNYGIPLCDPARRSESLDWMVAEVSSFQLELVVDFCPKIGVMLKLQPDHLVRHGTLQNYLSLKARLFSRMLTGDNAFVYDVDFDAVHALNAKVDATWHRFGRSSPCGFRYDAAAHAVWFKLESCTKSVSLAGTVFDNPVMGVTAAAAVGVAQCCGLDIDQIEKSIALFEPLHHRMEDVGDVDGVRFIDDSKATNLAALCAALEMTRDPVRLIAGGQLKEYDLNFIKEVLKNRVLSAYLIGEAGKMLSAAWGDVVDCRLCDDLKTAVLAAWQDSCDGELILLSPGCASFDQFRSYEDRGNQFKKIVGCIVTKKERQNEISID